MTTNLPAGWYADPADATRYRYWDGGAWTHDVVDRFDVDHLGHALDVPGSPTPRRRGRVLAVVGGLAALVAVAATAGLALGGDDEPVLTGVVRVTAPPEGGAFRGEGTPCGGRGGDGIDAGDRVTVVAGGEVTGRGRLRAGRYEQDLRTATCAFPFRVPGVGDAEVVVVRVDGRAIARIEREALEREGWRLDLRAG